MQRLLEGGTNGRRLLKEIRYFRYYACVERGVSENIPVVPSKGFLDVQDFLEQISLDTGNAMIKNNNLVKISLTCSKSAILNIEQNFVKLYFIDFENTISEKTYLNQEEILKKHQFFYFTPPPH